MLYLHILNCRRPDKMEPVGQVTPHDNTIVLEKEHRRWNIANI